MHSTTIGDEQIPAAAIDTRREGDTVTVTRWIENHEPAPLWRSAIGRPVRCDRWQIVRFEAPSTISIDVGVAPTGTGAPAGDRSQGVNGMVINAISPEAAQTSWYFWNVVRNFRTDDGGRQARRILDALTTGAAEQEESP